MKRIVVGFTRTGVEPEVCAYPFSVYRMEVCRDSNRVEIIDRHSCRPVSVYFNVDYVRIME